MKQRHATPRQLADVSDEDRPAAMGAPASRRGSLRAYLYFDAIVRYRSIRRAAQQIGIASSALNRRLIDFEAELGMPLFTRLRHGLQLTQAGELVAAHVRATLDDGAALIDRMRRLEGSVRGQVAIASAESAATTLLPPVLAVLSRDHQELQLTLVVGTPQTLEIELLAGRVDLILTHQQPRQLDIAVLTSVNERFCAVMRPGHPLAGEPHLTLQHCLAYPLVIAAEDLAARTLFDRMAQSVTLPRPVTLTTNLFETMRRFVSLTDAISFQFHLRPRAPESSDTLVAVPLIEPAISDAQLILAARSGRMLPPAVAEVASRIRAVMEA